MENKMSRNAKPCLTKRAPDAGDSGAIPSIFLRLSIFPIGRLCWLLASSIGYFGVLDAILPSY